MTIRRVLIAYTPRPPILEYLRRAFARRGVEVITCPAHNTAFDRFVIHPLNKQAHNLRLLPKSRSLFEDHPKTHKNHRSELLRTAIRQHDPDLVIVVRGIDYHPWALEGARRSCLWWVEADERLEEPFAELPRFDHMFCINRVGAQMAHERGFDNVSYLPHAVDPDAFRPIPEVRKDLDFCFVGIWSRERERHLAAALELTRSGAIYGPRWFKRTWKKPAYWGVVRGGYIAGEPLVRLYNRAKVVINVSLWGLEGGKARSGLNMRVFEVPACGAVLLTDSSRETAEIMTPGEHLETFSDLEDFQRKLAHLLQDKDARTRIGDAGRHHVLAHASYDQTVQRILDVFDTP
ncbi:glycosyltransferase [Niveibacterium sp. SC-1]|uniref:CgeB family protein n=1 Tax=Niveibacterium sp. SC-1 TaxID=3135646 RepID=UPI00311DC7F5